jgi:hypothetical protein
MKDFDIAKLRSEIDNIDVLPEKLQDMDVPGAGPKFTPDEIEKLGLDFVEDAIDSEDVADAAYDPDVAP